MKFGLFNNSGELVASFDNERDAEEFQNRKAPNTAKRRFQPNVFGEPDDIKQALYSSWADAEDARCLVVALKARYHFNSELKGELDAILEQLEKCGQSVRDFAPNFYRETVEDWAQAAAESNHP
jgi:hypothetical protein